MEEGEENSQSEIQESVNLSQEENHVDRKKKTDLAYQLNKMMSQAFNMQAKEEAPGLRRHQTDLKMMLKL